MKVLTDFHHGGLYNSLYLLIEKRLGWELYRPIGLDWFTHGFWKVAEPYGNAQDTINQYLAIDGRPYIPYVYLNGGHTVKNDVYYVPDAENNITHRAIRFDTFKEMEFDYIIGTHPLHDMWIDLLQYQKKAKFVMQLGNENQTTNTKNILSSVWQYQPQANQNVFYYHQEFDMEHLKYEIPINHNTITSMIHLLPHPEIFETYERALSDYEFKAYGMGCRNGIPNTRQEIGEIMKSTAFGWHIKPHDGYGHLIHQWYACGRPIITRMNDYMGKTGGLLLTDDVTCIDLDKGTVKENVDRIRYWSEPDNHRLLSLNAYKRFRDVVGFDTEAEKIREWLSII